MYHPQRVFFPLLPFIVAFSSEAMTYHIMFDIPKFALWSICPAGITNIAKRERNKGAKQLDALMKVNHLCCVHANANSSTGLPKTDFFFRNFLCHWERTRRTFLGGEICILMRDL
jgi:hypothetical protein